MINSSIGSDIFAVLAVILVSGLVFLVIRHFLPLKSTPAYLILPVFVSLTLPLSIIFVLPIDLASAGAHARGVLWLPERLLLVFWRIAYWLTFSLTWFILPMLGEYLDSGYRTPKDRLLWSIKSNARYYLMVFVCAGTAGIYVFLVNGFKTGSLKSLVMALAYCWGLILVIYLMGHGLVTVPRSLFRYASPSVRLRRLYSRVPGDYYKLDDAKAEVADLESVAYQLRRRANALRPSHEEWLSEILDDGAIEYNSSVFDPSVNGTRSEIIPAVVTDNFLAHLSRKLSRARHRRVRYENSLDQLYGQIIRDEAVIEARTTQSLQFSATPRSTFSSFDALFNSRMRYHLHLHLIPATSLLLGGLAVAASICIVWSELVKSVAPRISIISLSIMYGGMDSKGEVIFGLGQQVIASFWLFYMSIAIFSSFPDVKVWGNRALIRRSTYGESATWYASQVAKLSFPLAYNFLTCLQKDVAHKTTFYTFLGVLINLTPLGSKFDLIFPLFILVPICATLFGLYDRIGALVQFGFTSDENGVDGGWHEGKDIFKREHRLLPTGQLDRLGDQATASRVSTSISHPTYRSTPRDTAPARKQRNRIAQGLGDNVPDESSFNDFAHRVKNTLGGLQRPAWLEGADRSWSNWIGGRRGRNVAQIDEGRVRL